MEKEEAIRLFKMMISSSGLVYLRVNLTNGGVISGFYAGYSDFGVKLKVTDRITRYVSYAFIKCFDVWI